MDCIHIQDAIDLLSGRHQIGARSAYRAALEAPEQNYVIGASIMSGNKILGFSYNIMEKTHPQGSGIYSTLHAEVRVLRQVGEYQANNSTIYVIRINKQKFIRAAKPCTDCYKLLSEYGIGIVVSTINTGWLVEKVKC